jgi:CheY-like chemotaxis protein
MDGMETMKHLRDLGYDKPIVALTANAVTGQADMFLQNGFDAFISKPIDIRQLDSVLNNLIRDKQPPEVIEAAREQSDKTARSRNPKEHINVLLIESFFRDASKAIHILENFEQNYADEINLQKYIITVHGIKSSLMNIGEKELTKLAKSLEHAGREKNMDYINEFTPFLLSELKQLLEKFIPEHKIEYANPADLREKLEIICGMCGDYDRKGILDTILSIKETKCPDETKENLSKIREYINHSEFEKAENLIKEWKLT